MEGNVEWASKEISGKTRAWIEAGSGPAVILLHGFPDAPQGFLPQIEALAAAGYRAIAPYARGNPPSFVPADDDHSPAALANDLVEFLDGLGIDKAAAVVGHDWGAVTAYAFAALAPHRLERLVTLSVPHGRATRPTLTWTSLVLAMQTPQVASRFAALGNGLLVKLMIRRISPNWKFTDADIAESRRIMSDPTYLQYATGVYRALRRWPLRRDESFRLVMKRISVPTLCFAGTDDTAMPVGSFRKMAGAFEGPFELVELNNVGHFPQRESPDRVSEKILSFLGGPAKKKAPAASKARKPSAKKPSSM